jgi:D-sedoheptulose 7-phosphate isomerase
VKFDALFRDVADNAARIAADASYLESIAAAVMLLQKALSTSNKLLVFGNGGSSADAEHVVAELVGRFGAKRRPLAAVALGVNHAFLTAWSNDYSFEEVFARQIEALGKPGDVAWAISTSGNSANVVKALERARALGLSTIGLTGEGGGKIAQLCDVLMAVPLAETPRIQEIHVVTYHAICAALEERLSAL